MCPAVVDMKVVMLGKEYGGKTSLVERFLNDRFLGDTMPYSNTIGAAYGARTIEVGDKPVMMGIWDTAGSERYEAMSRIYYRGAKAAVVCFDLTDDASFQKTKFWAKELKQHEEECRIYLCGTKHDLVTSKSDQLRATDVHDARDYADEIGGELWETSSKSGYNIRELFTKIATDYAAGASCNKNQGATQLRLEENRGRKRFLCC